MISELYPRMLFDDSASGTGASGPAGGSSAPPSPPGGGAEGTSAPQVTQLKSSIPAEGPSTDSGSTSPGEGVDPFSGMDDDLDAIDLGVQGAPTDDESGEAPAPTQPAAKQQPATPAVPAGPQEVAPQGQPAGTPAAQRSQLEQAIDGFKANGNELALWASQNLFALSNEEAEALQSDAVAAIPKLMGKVYVNALQATTNLIKSFVPEMVQQGSAQQSARAARAAEAINEFYQTNPHLSADKHGAAVDKWARFFRGANPRASRQEAIAFVGRAVSAEFGLSPGGSAKRAAPFAPARPGARAPQRGGQPHDPYAGMEDEYD